MMKFALTLIIGGMFIVFVSDVRVPSVASLSAVFGFLSAVTLLWGSRQTAPAAAILGLLWSILNRTEWISGVTLFLVPYATDHIISWATNPLTWRKSAFQMMFFPITLGCGWWIVVVLNGYKAHTFEVVSVIVWTLVFELIFFGLISLLTMTYGRIFHKTRTRKY